MGRKAEVGALLPVKQAQWPAKSQVVKARLRLTFLAWEPHTSIVNFT